jgi:hypothetical protein
VLSPSLAPGRAFLASLTVAIAGCSGPTLHKAAPSSAYHSAPSSGESLASDGSSMAEPAAAERPGLGTSFGEARHSRVRHMSFERDRETPFAEVALHYNDAAGVHAALEHHGARLATARTHAHGDVAVTITDGDGRTLPGAAAGGRMYVVGADGERYNIEIRNDSDQRLEVVASVDGLDVIDGRPASFAKRGYIVSPFSTVVIDGFRTSDETVATFRFGAVQDSYAARTSGDRNVGVIGLGFFAERGSRWTAEEIHRRDTADPFPGRYAEPPR